MSENHTLSVYDLEAAINCCRDESLGHDCILPADLRAMAEVYGTMVFERSVTIDMSRFSAQVREIVSAWVSRSRISCAN